MYVHPSPQLVFQPIVAFKDSWHSDSKKTVASRMSLKLDPTNQRPWAQWVPHEMPVLLWSWNPLPHCTCFDCNWKNTLPHLNPEPARCFARHRKAFRERKYKEDAKDCNEIEWHHWDRARGHTFCGGRSETEWIAKNTTGSTHSTNAHPLRAFPMQKQSKACATFRLL
jgi:hypothetical protein